MGGTPTAGAGRNGALASAKPLDDRFVSGVPPAPSTGGGGGLPDLPREGRGRGVLSRGGRGMGEIYGRPGCAEQLTTPWRR